MRRSLAHLAVALALLGGSASAQTLSHVDPGRSVQTRSDLERLLVEYEQALASPAYSDGVKERIRLDVRRVRTRLDEGDFRVGDRIALDVQGEATLPDTVVVEPGPKVSLPLFGDVSLAGVLRSELEPHLTQALARYIREPVVRARSQMRLSVLGEVGRPGFYTMPADILLSEALMAAGGPMNTGDLPRLRIERGSLVLLEGEVLNEAMRAGFTLDQLNVQAGDQIFLPARRGSFWGPVSRYALVAASAIFFGFRIF